jgi:hypothetical protein
MAHQNRFIPTSELSLNRSPVAASGIIATDYRAQAIALIASQYFAYLYLRFEYRDSVSGNTRTPSGIFSIEILSEPVRMSRAFMP